MISYNEILTVIKAFSDGHKFEPRFYSEFLEQLPNLATEDIVFPVIFVEPVSGDTLENTDITEINVYCLDRLRKDRKNTNDIVSDTRMILSQDLTRWLEEGQQDIEVDRSYPATPYNNILLDYTSGWSMRVGIVNERISICEVPVNAIVPEPIVCDPATVIIKDSEDNTLSTNQFPSGLTSETIISDTTLTLNSNVFLDVLAEATQDIILQDQNTDPIVPASVVDNVVTVTIPESTTENTLTVKTGQTQRYVDYDDGDLQQGRLVDFFTLSANNPFGNTNRYTDTLGGQAYANDIFLDWAFTDGLVVYGWSRIAINSLTFDASITDAYGKTIDIFSNWLVGNRKQVETLINSSVSICTNWPPLSYATSKAIRTSTTDPNNPLKAFEISNANHAMSPQTKAFTGSRTYLPFKLIPYTDLGL